MGVLLTLTTVRAFTMTQDFKSQLSEKESTQRIVETSTASAEPEILTELPSASSTTSMNAEKTAAELEKSGQQSPSSFPDVQQSTQHSAPFPDEQQSAQHATSSFPDVQIVPDESMRLRQAMHTLLEIKNFKLVIAAGLTLVFVFLGQYAISHQSLQSPFSTVKTSETPDGYLDQAAIAYFKGDYSNASDAWKLAIDKAVSQKIPPLKIGEMYETVGDKITSVSTLDPPNFGPNFTNVQQKSLGQLYYSKALAVYQEKKLPERELRVRYKIDALNYGVDELDKETNLRAIVVLDETRRKATSEKLGRIYSELGHLLEEKGDIKDAEIYLQKAICSESNQNLSPYPCESRDIITLTRLLRAEHHYKDLLGLREYLVASKLHQGNGDTSIIDDLDKLAEAYKLTGNSIAAKNVEKHASMIRAQSHVAEPTPFYRNGFEIKEN